MKKLILITAVASIAVISSVAWGENDQWRSRMLMEQGNILPLQEILERLGQEREGRVLEVELDDDGGRYIYEIELLGEAGRVWEYKMDAATGEIIEREQED